MYHTHDTHIIHYRLTRNNPTDSRRQQATNQGMKKQKGWARHIFISQVSINVKSISKWTANLSFEKDGRGWGSISGARTRMGDLFFRTSRSLARSVPLIKNKKLLTNCARSPYDRSLGGWGGGGGKGTRETGKRGKNWQRQRKRRSKVKKKCGSTASRNRFLPLSRVTKLPVGCTSSLSRLFL